METGKLSRGAMIAVVSGLALLIVMTTLDWYGSSRTSVEVPSSDYLGRSAEFDAWQVFAVVDLLLLGVVVVAIAGGLIAGTSRSVNSPVVTEAVTCAAGILAVLLILFRIVDPPGDLHREVGVYLGLLAALGIAYGGWKAMADEGTSFSDQASRL